MKTAATQTTALDNWRRAHHQEVTKLTRAAQNLSPPASSVLLQRKPNCACGGGCPRCESRLPIQTKLAVSQPGDFHEQEADRVADQVMRMPAAEPSPSLREVGDDSVALQRSASGAAQVNPAPGIIGEVLGSRGQPLSGELRSFMEPRFGQNFSQVRVHTDERAAASANSVNASAYTVGRDIVFGSRQFAPDTIVGKQLLAHELAHVVQQKSETQPTMIQRFAGCTSAQDSSIIDDHNRAAWMLSVASLKLSSYKGPTQTVPDAVYVALATHFNGETSVALARWLNMQITGLIHLTSLAYDCFTSGSVESVWACTRPSELATTFWCVPGVNIRLCPLYFTVSEIERSTTLIHEWFHKWSCSLDLGYEHEPEYKKNSPFEQMLNADSLANFVRDVQ